MNDGWVGKTCNPPAATIEALGSLDICKSKQVQLQESSGVNYTYKWLKDGNKISGATNQTYTAASSGDYKVKITKAGSCTSTSDAVTVYSSCKLNGENSSTSTALFVSPNPCNGKFSLHISSDS